MKRYQRESLNDLNSKIEKLFFEARDTGELLEMMALEDALAKEMNVHMKTKKMGRVRVVNKWGLIVNQEITDYHQREFEKLPTLGIF